MSIVTLNVTCTSTKTGSERRFDKSLTILAVKGKLEMIVGAAAAFMDLRLRDQTGNEVCKLDNNEAMLGAYPMEDYFELYVIDKNPHGTADQFENVDKVEKIEMSEDDYASRTDSVRAFKQRNKMGRFNEEFQKEAEANLHAKDTEGEELAKTMAVGNRCEVRKGGSKRGVVMFVGKPDFASGWWIGVKLDEPLGKNAGEVKGRKYFDCAPSFGTFVRPADVVVGDFPEEELNFSDSDDEM